MQGIWTNATGFGHTPGYQPGNPISPALFAMPMGPGEQHLEYNLNDSEPTPWGIFLWSETQWAWRGQLGGWFTTPVTDNSLPTYISGPNGLETFTTLEAAKPYFTKVALWPFGLMTNTDYGPTARFPALDAGCLQLLVHTYPNYYYAADASLFRTYKMQSKYISSGLNTTGASLNQAMDYMAKDGNTTFNMAFGAYLYGQPDYDPANYAGPDIVKALVPKESADLIIQRALLFGTATENGGQALNMLSPYPLLLSTGGDWINRTWTVQAPYGSIAPRFTYNGNAEGLVVPLYTVDGNVMWTRDDGFNADIMETGYSYLYHSFWYVLGTVVQ